PRVVGDVRGAGLMLGVELVAPGAAADARPLPNPALAQYVKNRARAQSRVLLSCEGPYANVIKIKPPLCFSRDQAAIMIAAVREALDSATDALLLKGSVKREPEWGAVLAALFLQMEYGGTCHISGRPYTVFRWRPGNDARYKKTIICQDVAKAKNVCQVCLFDLEYGLPVQVRDQALGLSEDALPESAAGKEFALTRAAETGELDGRKFDAPASSELLQSLRRTDPYYKRNAAKICSFFVKGTCKRGAECPYRHELPESGPLSKQNIKDRYYGVNDPVAEKMLGRAAKAADLTPPEDASIQTLFVGGLGEDVSEEDVRSAVYLQGEVASVKRIPARQCAFVTFASRLEAERAASALAGRLIVKGARAKLAWAKPVAGAGGGSIFAIHQSIPSGVHVLLAVLVGLSLTPSACPASLRVAPEHLAGLATTQAQLDAGFCVQSANSSVGLSLAELTISESRRAFLDGTLTCRELVQGYITRILALDRTLGLFSVRATHPDALAEADKLDATLRETRLEHGALAIASAAVGDEASPEGEPSGPLAARASLSAALPPLFCVPVLVKDNI
ncbi:hypothetical protein H632_c989p0, partial [Helicosporidium sp. ATCC 50920]